MVHCCSDGRDPAGLHGPFTLHVKQGFTAVPSWKEGAPHDLSTYPVGGCLGGEMVIASRSWFTAFIQSTFFNLFQLRLGTGCRGIDVVQATMSVC